MRRLYVAKQRNPDVKEVIQISDKVKAPNYRSTDSCATCNHGENWRYATNHCKKHKMTLGFPRTTICDDYDPIT